MNRWLSNYKVTHKPRIITFLKLARNVGRTLVRQIEQNLLLHHLYLYSVGLKSDLLLFTDLNGKCNTPTKEASSHNDVTLYGVSWCMHCKNARQYFKTKGIAFKDYNPEESDKYRQEFDKLGGTGYPLIFVNGVRIVGFDEEAIEKALR